MHKAKRLAVVVVVVVVVVGVGVGVVVVVVVGVVGVGPTRCNPNALCRTENIKPEIYCLQ